MQRLVISLGPQFDSGGPGRSLSQQTGCFCKRHPIIRAAGPRAASFIRWTENLYD